MENDRDPYQIAPAGGETSANSLSAVCFVTAVLILRGVISHGSTLPLVVITAAKTKFQNFFFILIGIPMIMMIEKLKLRIFDKCYTSIRGIIFFFFKTGSSQEPKVKPLDLPAVKTRYYGSKLRNRC